MLPAAHRLRSAGDFRRTMRGGLRAARPALVVTGRARSPGSDPAADPVGPSARIGLVVAKSVGGAVTRNRVKRRLRHAVSARLDRTPEHTDWVVRALPSAATADDLADQLAGAWEQVTRKLAVRENHQPDRDPQARSLADTAGSDQSVTAAPSGRLGS